MKKTRYKRFNKKFQNGRRNPIWGKEFTPNGFDWVGYSNPSNKE